MEFKQIAREIDLVQLKFAKWRSKSRSLNPACATLVEAAIREFSQTIDELVAAYEDMERINTELIQTKMITEMEHQRAIDLFENAPLGYLILDRVGTIQNCNHTACQLLQAPRDLLVGQSLIGMVEKQDQGVLRSYLRHHRKGGEAGSVELRLTRSHPASDDVLLQIRESEDVDRQPAEFWVSVYDCASTPCVQAAVLANQERFLSLLALTPDVVWETDAEGTYTYTSPQVKETLGIEPEQMIGRGLLDFRPEVEMDVLEPILRHHLQEGIPIENLENIRLHQDGRMVNIKTSAQPLHDNWGRLVGFRGVDRVITERIQLEAILRDSQQKTRDILDSISDAYMEIDRSWRFVSVSQKASQILGYPGHTLIGKTVWETFPQLVGSEEEATYRELMDVDRPTHLELKWEPNQRSYDFRIYPTRAGITIYWVDITLPKQMEQERQERDEQYRQSLEKQARLGASRIELHHRLIDQREEERLLIARDLHDGPIQELSAANLTMQTILTDVTDIELRQQLQGLNDILKNQIQDLRAYAGELRPPTLSKYGLGKAILSHIDSFEAKNPEITVDLSETGRDFAIPEDILLALFRIYQEAMANIAKHAQASEVQIRLKKGPDRVSLEIRDNGVGFELPGDWLEMARQGHLGLVGLQERAEAVGGQIRIHSKKKRGSWVRVVVPIKPSFDSPKI